MESLILMESNNRNNKKRKNDSMFCVFLALKLTQIDFVRRDMQFWDRQQLRQMEILERKRKKS